jgi:hypothetical protein
MERRPRPTATHSAALIREATAKIEEHQRALKPENSHRTATTSEEIGADDKTDPVN